MKNEICAAITFHKLLWFYYESRSGNYWRKVEPYLLAIKDNGKGNVFFTGYAYPSNERITEANDYQGQYVVSKIDRNRFEIVEETFDRLKIPAERIFGELSTIEIICKVSF